MCHTPSSDDEEHRPDEEQYIDYVGKAFLVEIKTPTSRPSSQGLAQYTNMIHRDPNGPDPLVEEPGQ